METYISRKCKKRPRSIMLWKHLKMYTYLGKIYYLVCWLRIKTKKIFDLIHQRFSESKRRKHKRKSLNHKCKHFTFDRTNEKQGLKRLCFWSIPRSIPLDVKFHLDLSLVSSKMNGLSYFRNIWVQLLPLHPSNIDPWFTDIVENLLNWPLKVKHLTSHWWSSTMKNINLYANSLFSCFPCT